MLVAHGGVDVAATGCGGRRWSSFFFPLLRCAFFFPYFFVLPVNSILVSLQRLRGGAGSGGLGADSGRSTVLLPLLCVFPFFCSLFFLFCFFGYGSAAGSSWY